MKTLFALMTFVSSVAFAAPIPPKHQMNCWDHTFAYNRLAVVEQNGKVDLTISGQNLTVFTELTGEKGWGQLEVHASFPAAACRTSQADLRLLKCKADELTLTIVKHDQKTTKRQIKMKYVSMDVRKITEVDAGLDDKHDVELVAYELTVKSFNDGESFGDVLKLIQTYGTFGDASDACKLN